MSHMRMPNDYRLAEQCGGYIDILLGGHDHHYEDTVKNNIRILNSGTDFGDFSVVQVSGRNMGIKLENGGVLLNPLETTCRRVTVDQSSSDDDPEMVEALLRMSKRNWQQIWTRLLVVPKWIWMQDSVKSERRRLTFQTL
mmetsp:Transcript_22561/g.64075  ORF Transcript_22561/g.64075 Transcript_22561/m.64075 type:complete len:140 (+) Transcript_22561:782-1201(+)